MSKLSAILLFSGALIWPLCHAQSGFDYLSEDASLVGYESFENEDNFGFDGDAIEKGPTVTVTTAAELNAAIQSAAGYAKKSTTIKISGMIVGNILVPATVNTIRLVGAGSNAGINADGNGSPLTILLGASVTLENLRITGSAAGGSGIVNSGSVGVYNSTISGNAGNGIQSVGPLYVNGTAITSNGVYGIESYILNDIGIFS